MNKDRIIQHLNALAFKYKMEISFLEQYKKTPTNPLHQKEIEINIEFYKAEIADIEEQVKSLETL